MERIPCFLCGEFLLVKSYKESKRYFICNACGVQAFVRRPEGIEKLGKLLRHLDDYEFQFAQHKKSFLQVCAILQEIAGLKQEIEKLRSGLRVLFRDPDRERAIKALKVRIKRLLSILEKHAKEVEPIPL